MKLSEIAEIENELEYEFHNLEKIIETIKYKASENDININTSRLKNNVRSAFDDIKRQLEDLKIREIRK